MNERSIRLGFFVAALAIFSMVFSTLSSAQNLNAPVIKVVTVKEALVMSDQERINLFIDELIKTLG